MCYHLYVDIIQSAQMKLTQEVIDQIQEAMNHTKKNGDINWVDGDDIDVCLAGTFAADRFIVIPVSYTHLTLPTICSV